MDFSSFDDKVSVRGEVSVPAYRLYFLDGAGNVSGAEWIDAADDAAAMDAARSLDRRCEVWIRQRLVGRVDRGSQS